MQPVLRSKVAMDFRKLLQEERRRARQQQQQQQQQQRQQKAETDGREHEASSPPKGEDRPSLTEERAEQPLATWSQRPVLDVERFRKGPIPNVYYVPDWISDAEERAILDRIYSMPDNNGDNSKWVTLRGRRLQMWGGEVRAPFRAEPLPRWLSQIAQSLVDAGIFTAERKPNHALINEYGVGEGIMPHEDGPSYFPLVAIVSVGNSSRVNFEPHRKLVGTELESDHDAGHRFSFTLERRSLLLFTDKAYTHYLHSIDNVVDGTRLSLTVRHVHLP